MSWSGPSHNEKPPVPTGEQQQHTFPPPPTDQKTELPAGQQQGQQPYFPPPPPGPPPANQPQYTHAPQTQQPQYAAPPPQQQQQQYAPPPAQQADYNPAQYGGAGHHYPPPGADHHTDPAAAAAFAATAPDTTKPQKQHKGWSERLTQIGMKAAGPINAMANKMGSQSFLPTTMDKECEKAAKILQSFCKEGIASDVPPQQTTSEKLEPGKTDTGSGSGSSRPVTPNKAKKEQKAIVKIPSKVINKAVGLAIFTTFRAGFQFSGATGSGVLVARLPDGSWGPPSGIQVHAVGAGFMIGADIHDTVLIINSREALNAFLGNRVSLGSDVAVVAGPYGAGGVMDVGASFGGKSQKEGEQKAADEEAAAAAAAAAKPAGDGKLKPEDDKKAKRRSSSTSLKPNFSYVKSRGFYAGVQVDGTVVTERKDANAAFYGQKVSVDQIIKGQVPPQGPAGQWPGGAHLLYEALRTAEAQQPLPEANLPPPAPVPATGPVPTTSLGQAPPGYGQQSPPGYGQPPQGYGQYPQGGPLGSHPPQSGPTASGALGDEQLPGYVEDNVPRPGVGDHKQQYQ